MNLESVNFGYIWNAMFGILYSAVNYKVLPHCSMCKSIM